MRRYLKTYYYRCTGTVLLLLCGLLAAAQATDTVALYIAPTGTMYVHGNVQMSVKSKVINGGAFGTMKGATVNMLGDYWRNDAGASFPDETGLFGGTGGNFRFAASGFQQHLVGGYAHGTRIGAHFPSLSVANAFGLHLSLNDAMIRSTLNFESGLLWLDGNNLVVGNGQPGAITGYTETSFIATNNTSLGGYLYRSGVRSNSGSVMFPVGTQGGSFAPVSLMFNTTTPQELGVRVFDNIYSNATSGTTGDASSVQQTWNIVQETQAKVPAIVAIQHLSAKEGAGFSAHRKDSYISRYLFPLQTWDTVPPSGVSTPGTFTTGTANPQSHIHVRSFDSLGYNTFLTKTADTRVDSITLAKGALTPVRQPDGSFLVTYVFLVHNKGTLPIQTLSVQDTLTKVFASPATFSVVSLKASGSLQVNPVFDGTANTELLLPSSTIRAGRVDTITLALNVLTNSSQRYFYNSATVRGMVQGFGGRQSEVDSRSVQGLLPSDLNNPPSPTQVVLSPSKYVVQEGMSPNGDGINDKFTIANLGLDQAAIWIFDKDGVLVYRSANYKNDWDGTANEGGSSSKKVNDGTYFYKIIITEAGTGKQETLFGFLSVWK